VLRRGCLRKYGFDPIDDETAYWRYGLAEPDHRDVLREVRRNGNRFSIELVRRWEIEEAGIESAGFVQRPQSNQPRVNRAGTFSRSRSSTRRR